MRPVCAATVMPRCRRALVACCWWKALCIVTANRSALLQPLALAGRHSPPRQRCASGTGTPRQSRRCPEGAQAAQQRANAQANEDICSDEVTATEKLAAELCPAAAWGSIMRRCTALAMHPLVCEHITYWQAVPQCRAGQNSNSCTQCATLAGIQPQLHQEARNVPQPLACSPHTAPKSVGPTNTYCQVLGVDDVQLCLQIRQGQLWLVTHDVINQIIILAVGERHSSAMACSSMPTEPLWPGGLCSPAPAAAAVPAVRLARGAGAVAAAANGGGGCCHLGCRADVTQMVLQEHSMSCTDQSVMACYMHVARVGESPDLWSRQRRIGHSRKHAACKHPCV